MLVIRQEQMDVFERESLRDCAQFVSNFLCNEAFEKELNPDPHSFEPRVREGVLRALKYGLESYADIASFVAFLFSVGPAFDRYPFFQSVLTDPDIATRERMTTLVELSTDDDWAVAFADGGKGSWRIDG